VVPPLGFLPRELWRDKSVQRAGMNWVFLEWQKEFRGLVFDLGCGSDPSGVRDLARRGGARYIGVDISRNCKPTVAADLDLALPFADGVADAVVIANCFYIVRRPGKLLEETRRVLKQDGVLMLVAPLIWQHYPEPKDFWRFTSEAVDLLLQEAGFKEISLAAVGGRWSSAAHLISPYVRPGRILRPLVHLVAVALDELCRRVLPRVGGVPLVCCAKARKA
jgi:SAM-dependent methyltransferase